MRNKCRMCKHYIFDPSKAYAYEDHCICEYCNFEYDEEYDMYRFKE